MAHTEARDAHQAIAERMRDLRHRRGWSAQRLADAMAAAGVTWDRYTVVNLERGRRTITVQEWLALAYVLDVAPVHLVAPLEDDARCAWAPTPVAADMAAAQLREWIRGRKPAPGQDVRVFDAEVPESEYSAARTVGRAQTILLRVARLRHAEGDDRERQLRLLRGACEQLLDELEADHGR